MSLAKDPAGGGGECGYLKLNSGSFRDQYKVGSLLGEGAFGQVRLVTSKVNGTKAAVKIIEKAKIDPGDHALRTEIDILCRVDHENCVCLHEWFDEPKRVLLVMEFVTGGTLFDRIVNHGKFNEEAGRKAFVELASGLAYLHELKIAHRDLKPENFMLSSTAPDACVKLTDYGLSKILVDPKATSSSGVDQTVCGTPSYVAPEILTCLDLDEATYNGILADGWSLGCNLFILLSGYPPFWKFDDNQAELFRAIKRNDWSFDQPVWREISEDAKDLIRELMEPDLKKRLTAKDALSHKWVTGKAPEKELTGTMENMRKLLMKQRFKRAVNATVAQQRFANTLTTVKSGKAL